MWPTLVPSVGPYDVWATHWGYQPIAGAKTPDDEKVHARRMVARTGQDTMVPLLDAQFRRLRSG